MFSPRIIKGCLVFMLLLGFDLICTTLGTQAAQSSEQIEEKRALGFVAAVGGGELDSLLSYTEQNFSPQVWQGRSPDEWRALAHQLVQRHAGIQVQGVEITQPHNVAFMQWAPTGRHCSSFSISSRRPPTASRAWVSRPGAGRRE